MKNSKIFWRHSIGLCSSGIIIGSVAPARSAPSTATLAPSGTSAKQSIAQITPAQSKVLLNKLSMASSLCHQAKYKECIELTTNIIQHFPHSEEAYCLRGESYYETDQFHRALADLGTYFKLHQGEADIGAVRIRGLTLCQFGQYNEALKDFDVCVKAKPGIWDFWQDRAKAYAELGQFDKAISNANEMVKLKPDNFRYALRAKICFSAGKYQQSLDDWNKAIKLSPDRANYYASRAECYDKLGRKDLAAADRKERDSLSQFMFLNPAK